MSVVHDPLRPMTGPGGVREVVARWVITAELVLESAAHLGNGDPGDAVDMLLTRDRVDHRPLLTGSSLAGGLRSHLNDLLLGYGGDEDAQSAAAQLFGRGDEDGSQSSLIVFDSRGSWPEKMSSEVRDGVALSPSNGTAELHFKYDMEVLPPGTTFPLRFELLVSDPEREAPLLGSLAAALGGLEQGEIGIGARRSRGLGACRAAKWRARRFDLSNRNGWLAWLTSDHEQPTKGIQSSAGLPGALSGAQRGLRLPPALDQRDRFVIEADLQVKGGLIVRSPGQTASSADVAHLHSGGEPVLPGTSVAGALRTRALRIAGLVRGNHQEAERWVEGLFGPRPDGKRPPWASRLRVSERVVTEGQSLQQARIRGDRVTGGVVDGGLFDEEPVFKGRMKLRLELRRPRPGEAGLLLLVLKDLLSGDLPLGGASAVGRGVVTGRAEVFLHESEAPARVAGSLAGASGSLGKFDPLTQTAPETVAKLNGLVDEFRNAPVAAEGP